MNCSFAALASACTVLQIIKQSILLSQAQVYTHAQCGRENNKTVTFHSINVWLTAFIEMSATWSNSPLVQTCNLN